MNELDLAQKLFHKDIPVPIFSLDSRMQLSKSGILRNLMHFILEEKKNLQFQREQSI